MITRGCRWRIGGFLKSSRTVPSSLTRLISHAEDLISDFWEQHPEQRPRPKNQATTKGGKGKLPSLEISSPRSKSKSKSRSRYEDAMDVDFDDRPQRKEQRLTNASKHASSSSAGARANGKSFSKLKQEATESADEHTLAEAQPSSEDRELYARFDLMKISRSDMRERAESVETVERYNGELIYYINL